MTGRRGGASSSTIVAIHRGGSPEARALYPTLHWETNESAKPALDWRAFPLDVVVVERVRKPAQFMVNDPAYRATAERYATFDTSCAVCDARGALLCVFVTSAALPALERVADQARVALEEARRDLKPRTTFAVGGDYARDPLYREKVRRAKEERMLGTIWNDGLQTWTTASPGWQGMYFTQYFRRAPGSDPTAFSQPYVGIYAAERAVAPAIADERLRLHRRAGLPCAFKGVPCELMPATQVGISEDFAVKTHADSCISSVTETIFWANRGVRGARFAVTSAEIAFDIGARPCLLLQKGNEMHGTVPGAKGSCGLVLISKRNTLQQFQRGAYTDRTHVLPDDDDDA